jgi:hypothetical protein
MAHADDGAVAVELASLDPVNLQTPIQEAQRMVLVQW